MDLRSPRETLGRGVTAIVDLAASEPPVVYPRDIVYCRLPLCDGGDNGAARLRLAIATTTALVRAGTPTLVACSMGMSRSPAIAAAALAQVEQLAPDKVLTEIAEAGPLDVDAGLWREVKNVVAAEKASSRVADEFDVKTPRLSLVVVRTERLEMLVDFYHALGMRFVAEQHGRGPLHYSAVLEETVLEIYPALKPDEVDASTRLGFRVEGLARIIETLRAAGATIVADPKQTEWGERAVVRDPDGRAVELYA